MPFTEDLQAFYALGEFGTSATDGALTILGIFMPNYVEPFGMVEGSGPVFRCELATVAAVAQNDTFVINTVTYRVKKVKKNEPTPGEVLLELKI